MEPGGVCIKLFCCSHLTYFVDDLRVDIRKDVAKKGHILSESGFKLSYQDNQESQKVFQSQRTEHMKE